MTLLTPQPDWNALVPRLEADLQARDQPRDAPFRDEDAWDIAAQILRVRARVILTTHSGLQQEDAEDIAQNVLVKLQSLSTMRRLRAAGSAEGYIVVMLRNAATDLVRRRQREKALLGRLGDELSKEPVSEAEYIFPPERTSALAEALERLTEEERALLKMRFWSNMSIGDIAARTGIAYSATAVRLFRTLRRLRDYMS